MSHTPKKKQPRAGGAAGFLLGCFGFPHSEGGNIITSSKENLKKPSLDGSIIKVPKRRKWFSWARKQRSATKTVPLDATAVPEKPRRSWSKDVNNIVKRKKGGNNRSQPLVNHVDSVPSPVPESTTPNAQKTSRTMSNSDQRMILGNEKSTKTNLDTIEEDTIQETPSSSVTPIATTISTTGGRVLAHSLSLPLNYKGKKLATTNGGGDSPTTTTKKSKDTVDNGRVDSVVGMSIILVMLLIMLLWGKVCAILCTSAWFYFVPRFRIKDGSSKSNKNDSSSSMGDQVDINSQLYKKKVVLEGILERKNNHRNSVVFNSK
ncbi:hypothetical protein LIER_07157 [Lithospermum erythrorhizon]|uniref:Uncharacterized protein n=1 Tax=Lithospermum erythrorhizon TaxID=34254 RepID=A0AAV3PBG8_LITER